MAKTAKTQAAGTHAVYQQLPVPDLTGGLDLRQDVTLLETDRARRLLNWALSTPGALTVRPGFQAFASFSSVVSTLGTGGPAQGGQRVYLNTNLPTLNSTTFTLVANSGRVWFISDSGGAQVVTVQALSTGSMVSFVYDRD